MNWKRPVRQPAATVHRSRDRVLGLPELIAIALGGMVGGGIFTILGVSVAMVGAWTPLVIALGGGVAGLAAWSYVKLALYYQDEGATYSFFKRTFYNSPRAAALIGWWVVFGYISTLALYAYTFSSYAISGFELADEVWLRKLVAGAVILVFALINIWSVRGMGKLEDLIVYTKLVLLAVIAFVLINRSTLTVRDLAEQQEPVSILSVMIIASLTFVAFEGFQLVIHAMKEMRNPIRNTPRAIYSAVAVATIIYVVIALGAVLAIPFEDIVERQEYALAAGTSGVLGNWGRELMVLGALLATSSAISGTLFGASRLMAVIADDGYLPAFVARRRGHIPTYAIIVMAAMAYVLIVAGDLRLILEFGSVTFLLVSFLMAVANFRIRDKTGASVPMALLSIIVLLGGVGMIFWYEFQTEPAKMVAILLVYFVLSLAAMLYASRPSRAAVPGRPDTEKGDMS
jgi:amino acid transporter